MKYEASTRHNLGHLRLEVGVDNNAQQPAKATNGMIEGFDMRPPRPSDAFDTNVRCKVCGEHDAHETMEPGFYDGREVTFVHKKCNKPPAKTLEQRVADLEARFPGELQDGC